MAKGNKIASYIGNLGKSIAYSTIDVAKTYAPGSTSFVETNKELFKDVYAGLSDYKNTYKNFVRNNKKNNKLYRALDEGFKAIRDDIKTGNFYGDKERVERLNLEAMGSLGDMSMDDFDMGDDSMDGFDMDFDFDDEEESTASAIERASRDSSAATSMTIAKSGEAIMNASKLNTQLLMAQNAQIGTTLSMGLTEIGKQIANLNSLGEPIITHAENSKKYFETTTKQLDTIVNILQSMNERQIKTYSENVDSKKKEKLTYGDVVDSEGMPDLKTYGKVLQSNLKKTLGPTYDMLFGDTMGEGSNMLLAFAANPLKAIPDFIAKSLVPMSLARAAESFDKSLSGVFSTMIANFNRMAKDDDAGIMKYVGQLFGISSNVKTTIDPSKYNKGPIPFDGLTRKSIIEVIPGHLRRIEQLLGGGNERVFDFNKGTWTNAGTINKEYQKMTKEQPIKEAFSEILPLLEKTLKDNVVLQDFHEQERWSEGLEELLNNIYNNYGSFRFNDKDELKEMESGTLTEEMLKVYQKAFQELPREVVSSMAGNVLNARNNANRRITDLENSGTSIYNELFSKAYSEDSLKEFAKTDKKKNHTSYLSTTLDDKGRNIYYYLQGLLSEVHAIRLNGGNGIGTSSSLSDSILDTIPRSDKYDDSVYRDRDRRSNQHSSRVNRALERDPMSVIDTSQEGFVGQARTNIEIAANNERIRQRSEDEKKNWLYNIFSNTDTETANATAYINREGSLFEQLKTASTLGDKFQIFKEGMGKLVNKPAEYLTTLLEKSDQRIYEMMFGYEDGRVDKNGKPIKGFMGYLINEVQLSFEKLNTFINEKILDPLMQKLGVNNFKDLFEKGLDFVGLGVEKRQAMRDRVKDFLDPYTSGIKTVLDDALKTTKSAVKETTGEITDAIGITTIDDDGSRIKSSEKGTRTDRSVEGLQSLLNRTNDDIIKRSIANSDRSFDDSKLKYINPNRANRQSDLEYAFSSQERFVDGFKDGASATDLLSILRGNKSKQSDNELDSSRFGYANLLDTQEHAKGTRLVTKTGITTISEGEMIIPSELNPLNPNRFNVNKDEEIMAERAVRDKYLKEINDPKTKLFMNATGNPSVDIDNDIVAQNRILNGSDKENKAVEKAKSDMLQKFEKYAPEAMGYGLVGGGISLLTGAIGGPLFGAAVGSAISLARRSNTVQNMLFGEVGKDGERDGGLIGKDTRESFKKYFPDLRNYGITGALAGLLTPLGPVGGLLVGSSIAFAKNNETFREFVFGKLNELGDGREEGGLISPKTVELIKKAAPKMAIGAIAGSLLGPFGLLGNAALGSGIGFVTSTNKFKDIILGEEDDEGKRKGGLLGAIKSGVIEPTKEALVGFKDTFIDYLKKDILEPLKDFIDPLKQEIKNVLKDIGSGILHRFYSITEKFLGIPLDQFLKERLVDPFFKLGKGLFKTALAPAKFLLSAPFKGLGAMGRSMRRNQIRKGKANDMTAEERIDFMKENGGFFNNMLGGYYDRQDNDYALMAMDNDTLKANMESYGEMAEGTTYFSKQIKEQKRKMSADVVKYLRETGLDKRLTTKQRNQFLKDAQNGDMEGAIRRLNTKFKMQNRDASGTKRMTKEQQDRLRDLMREASENIAELQGRKEEAQRRIDSGLEYNDPNARYLYEMYQREYKARTRRSEISEDTEAIVEGEESNTIKIIDSASENTDKIVTAITHLGDILKDLKSAPLKNDFGAIARRTSTPSNVNLTVERVEDEEENVHLEEYALGTFKVPKILKKGARKISNTVRGTGRLIDSMSRRLATVTGGEIIADPGTISQRSIKLAQNQNTEMSDNIEYQTRLIRDMNFHMQEVTNKFGEILEEDKDNTKIVTAADGTVLKYKRSNDGSWVADGKDTVEAINNLKDRSTIQDIFYRMTTGIRDSDENITVDSFFKGLKTGAKNTTKWFFNREKNEDGEYETEDEANEGKSLLSRIFGYAFDNKLVTSFLPKFLLGATSLALIGHADLLITNTIMPKLKEWSEESPLFNKIYNAILDFPEALKEFGLKTLRWMGGIDEFKDSGLPKVFNDYIIPFFITGISRALEYTIPNTFKLLVSALPNILEAAISGLGKIIGGFFGKDEVEGTDGRQSAKDIANSFGAGGSSGGSFSSQSTAGGFKSTNSEINSKVDESFIIDNSAYDSAISAASMSSSSSQSATSVQQTEEQRTQMLEQLEANNYTVIDDGTGGTEETSESETVTSPIVYDNNTGEYQYLGNEYDVNKTKTIDEHADTYGDAITRAALTGNSGILKAFNKIPIVNLGTKPLTMAGDLGKSVFGKASTNVIEEASQAALQNATRAPIDVDSILNATAESADNVSTGKMMKTFNELLAKAKNVISTTFKDSKFYEEATKVVQKFSKLPGMSNIANLWNSKGKSLFKGLANMGEKVVSLLRNIGPDMIPKFIKSASSRLAKWATNVLPVVGQVICIAFLIADFVSGINNTDTVFGVTDEQEITFNMRLVSGLITLLTNNITLGLLPASKLMDIILNVFEDIGWFEEEIDELRLKQEEAQATLDEWNMENPDNQYASIEEFNARDKGFLGFTKKTYNYGDYSIDKQLENGSTVEEAASKVADNIINLTLKQMENIQYDIIKQASDELYTSDMATGYNPYVGYGKGKSKYSGYGSRDVKNSQPNLAVSQLDPEVANMSYNNKNDTIKQTIGDSGCAPVAASNMINQMSGRIDVEDAAKYALNNGYKDTNGGTKIEYFGNILKDNGIVNATTSSKQEMEKALTSNMPMIVLGKDGIYGNNSHYLNYTGYNKGGKYYIEDPNDKSIYRYVSKSDLLKNATSSVLVGANNSIYTTGKVGLGSGYGAEYTIEEILVQDLGSYDTMTTRHMNDWINEQSVKYNQGSVFKGNGSYFIEASLASGLDPRYIYAHAAVESAHGTSDISRTKYNFFGIGAFDSNPTEGAHTFKDVRTGIVEGAKWIAKNYYNGSFKQRSLYTMRFNNGKHQYATDPNWANNIASIMKNCPYPISRFKYKAYKPGEVDPKLIQGEASSDSDGGIIDTVLGTASTIYDKVSGLATAIQKAIYGEDAVNAIMGSASAVTNSIFGTSEESNYTGSSDTYGGTTANEWFTKGSFDPSSNMVVTSSFGPRSSGYHQGIDYAPAGVKTNRDLILSPVNGTVVFSGAQRDGSGNLDGYGYYCQVQDTSGYIHTFAHFESEALVSKGDTVSVGDPLGIMGNTGTSSGKHLHYDIRRSNGNRFDPTTYNPNSSGLGTGPKAQMRNMDLTTKVQRPSLSSNTSGSKTITKGTHEGEGNTRDYYAILAVIVEVLTKIADNSDKLNDVIKVLKDGFGVDIETTTTKKSSSVDTEAMVKKIQSALNNSNTFTGQNVNKGTSGNGSGTSTEIDYIMSSMKAIASS